MNTPGRDPDEDMRRLLDEDGERPGAAHDSNVLRAARELAAASAREVAAAATTAPRPRRLSNTRTWALAASVAVVLVGATFEWRALHTHDGSGAAELWVAPGLFDPGVTRGQREAPRIEFTRGATTVRLRLRVIEPAAEKVFDAELSTSSGRVVHSARGIHPIVSGDATELDVDVPASTLRPGSYAVTVRPEVTSDGAAADDYVFKVP